MLIEYDSDIIVKPEYLTIEIYKKILQNALNIKFPEILRIKCSMGSKTGENYCSQIYRTKIFYKNENSNMNVLSVIIKSMPPSESADFLGPLNFFFKEKTIYCDILPCLEKMLSGNLRFGPRIYHSLAEPINTLVFEDLNALGFKMASRESGLDEAHARLVLERLAQFHASSMVLVKEHPSIKENFTTGMLAPVGLANDNGTLMRFFGGCVRGLIGLVQNWPGYESITGKLRSYEANLRENFIASGAASVNDSIQVLNHGDLWVNNMLFKYDSTGKLPLDQLMLDFQLSVWSSPGIDLNYFFYTSLKLDLLKYKIMILLEYYHNELCATLRQLNHAELAPSLEQIKKEFRNRAAYGFFANSTVFPTISMDKELSNDSNLDNFMNEDFARKKFEAMFKSKRLEETLRYTLTEFDKLGIWN